MATRYTVPDQDTGFGRAIWGVFAVGAVATAIGVPVTWLRGELTVTPVLAVVSVISALIGLLLRRAIGSPASVVVDDVAGTLTTVVDDASGNLAFRRRPDVHTYTFAEVGELTTHEVILDRDGPETWYELRASGVEERLHFTTMRSVAERRARKLGQHLKLHHLRKVLQRPLVSGGPVRAVTDDLTELQRVAGSELHELLAKLERDRDPDVARRAQASHAKVVTARGHAGD